MLGLLGISIFTLISIIFRMYRISKILDDLKTIWEHQKEKVLFSLGVNIVFVVLIAIMINQPFLRTVIELIWVTLIVWYRLIRLPYIFLVRYLLVLIPLTHAFELILSDKVLELTSDTLIQDIANNPEILNEADSHFVTPHHVKSYIKSDGSIVEGYWRDGDGNTAVNLTEAEGGGYFRSNPNSPNE